MSSIDYKYQIIVYNPVISSDEKVIKTNSIIYYHIVNPYKAVYETENFEKKLEDLQITSFREISKNLDLWKIQNINDSIKLDFKSILNK